MEVRTIKMRKKYLSNIESLKETKKETKSIIDSVYCGFMNEFNKNNYDYCIEGLVGEYRYIPKQTCVTNGSYIRFIDVKDVNKMRLHKGGFVLFDNGYSIVFKSEMNTYKMNRKDKVFFIKIKESEKIRLAII